ncbi:DUF2161 domain-containing phosphodiesterase [Pararhodospirillum photometricum]|uniref:DUF2161 domain-containing phosphodiesterase n=1 Tax=Pararhodospirillum photometricum DSM 122 TaxID=1150469 RepID=H6SR68_PARPM|nr:DUF2161 family putative PD-(D/E)XK-type phosphodiesterase [Pararhodospirillum photometricum]CCG09790.1 Putative uncharacterized protein [Pararhodospirillum photometricum DSM 122]
METDLYAPVKRTLETLGFTVKGEVRGCDLVALKDGQPELVVIGELKQSFTLELVLQAVERWSACDEVWLAVRASKTGRGRERDPRVIKLCRLLGLGLLGVSLTDRVDILCEPAPYHPRPNLKKRARLVEEFRRRQGDPMVGGTRGRQPQMTAYRQQALVVASGLVNGPSRPRDLKAQAPQAAKILQANVYGWFERIERGVYTLSPAGHHALKTWPAPT